MKYNLNLTQDYVKHWGLKEAIRELIANNIDEGGSLSYTAKTTLEGEERLSMLVFKTEKELPIEAFLLGYSVKSNPDAIGQYGEGLKLAMLVLTREHQTVLFKSGGYFYRFFFEMPEGFGVSTLHLEKLEINPAYDDEEPVVGTEITVFDIERSLLENCYTYSPPNQVVPKRRGLFCQGLLVEEGFYVRIKNVEYGVNLAHAVKGNRDRNYFPDKELVVPILEKTFQPEELLNISTSWYSSSIYEHFSPEFKQAIACKWFLKNSISYTEESISGKRILIPCWYGERYSRKAGYLIAPYWGAGSSLMNDEDKRVLASLKIDDEKIKTDEDYTERRKAFTEKLLGELRLASTLTEFLEALVIYVPGLGHAAERAEVTEEIIGIARAVEREETEKQED